MMLGDDEGGYVSCNGGLMSSDEESFIAAVRDEMDMMDISNSGKGEPSEKGVSLVMTPLGDSTQVHVDADGMSLAASDLISVVDSRTPTPWDMLRAKYASKDFTVRTLLKLGYSRGDLQREIRLGRVELIRQQRLSEHDQEPSRLPPSRGESVAIIHTNDGVAQLPDMVADGAVELKRAAAHSEQVLLTAAQSRAAGALQAFSCPPCPPKAHLTCICGGCVHLAAWRAAIVAPVVGPRPIPRDLHNRRLEAGVPVRLVRNPGPKWR